LFLIFKFFLPLFALTVTLVVMKGAVK